MKIYTNQIPEQGQSIYADYDPCQMDMERPDIKSIEKISISGYVTRCGQELILNATIDSTIEFVCARCLEPFSYPVSKKVNFTHHIEGRNAIDITEDVRQEVLLEYPVSSVCRSNCKGLCKACGKNLNEGSHRCV